MGRFRGLDRVTVFLNAHVERPRQDDDVSGPDAVVFRGDNCVGTDFRSQLTQSVRQQPVHRLIHSTLHMSVGSI